MRFNIMALCAINQKKCAKMKLLFTKYNLLINQGDKNVRYN